MDPTLKNRVLSDLKTILPDLPRSLRTAAKYIVDHPSDFGLDPIRETARKAGVSPYTLVRLAERIKFSGFEELREPFRHALVSSAAAVEQPDWVDAFKEHGPFGEVQATAAHNTLAIVQRSLQRQIPEQLQRIVKLLFEADTVYLTATRASYSMAYYLHYVGRMALPSLQLIPRHMTSPIDDLNSATENDVMIAITFTPYSRETIEACRFAHSKGVKLIMISDSEIVDTQFTPDETLIVSVLSPHHFGCYAGAMAVIETLIALLVDHGGEESKKRIKSYEDLRRDTQAYWVAQKNVRHQKGIV